MRAFFFYDNLAFGVANLLVGLYWLKMKDATLAFFCGLGSGVCLGLAPFFFYLWRHGL